MERNKTRKPLYPVFLRSRTKSLASQRLLGSRLGGLLGGGLLLLLGGGGGGSRLLSSGLGLGRSPESLREVSSGQKEIKDQSYQVISKELHNEGRVLVALLAEGIKF